MTKDFREHRVIKVSKAHKVIKVTRVLPVLLAIKVIKEFKAYKEYKATMNMAVPLPNSCSLTHCTAWSKDSARSMVSTGPKISSR